MTTVRLTNANTNTNCVLMSVPYSEILKERLRLLQNWVSQNSLSQALALVLEAAREEGYNLTITEKDLDKLLHGERGMITSCLQSLNGNNQNRPSDYTSISKMEGNNPYFVDSNGARYVRGQVVGSYPYKNATNDYTAARNIIEKRLNLPRYVRHRLETGDETL